VLGLLDASPEYDAVNGWLPTERVERTSLALPLPMVAVPRVVVLSLKVTVPVALKGLTVAVRVTCCPALAGFGEAERLVVVAAAAVTIDSVTAAEVLEALLTSPA